MEALLQMGGKFNLGGAKAGVVSIQVEHLQYPMHLRSTCVF